MKVLLVGPRFHTNQYQMVKTLKACGHEVFFHVASAGATEDYTLLTPVIFKQSRLSVIIEKIFGTGGVNHPNYFPDFYGYWKVVRELKPDIVIIRDPQRFFSLMAALYSRMVGAKVIFYTQENLFRQRSQKTKMKQRLLIRLFKAAWMVPIMDEQVRNSTSLKHMYYVPLPIPIQVFSDNDVSRDKTKILMIGKYNQKRKNHMLLINAVDSLKNRYDFTVTMVGECARDAQLVGFEKIREAVCRLGLSNIIEMKKDVPYSKIGELYKSHHVFVLPAVDEQYGISVTEALGHGMPVICTDTCGARFNVKNGENGFVVKSNSLSDLTDALESVIRNPDICEEMGRKSQQYVRSHLSGQVFYQRFINLVSQRFQINFSNVQSPETLNY